MMHMVHINLKTKSWEKILIYFIMCPETMYFLYPLFKNPNLIPSHTIILDYCEYSFYM